ncbi:MAG TPA: zinc ribbon domain-containing protein [Pyrinomonadaceae bacterium]|nr:zinc ribbon domain-containing protein [Pyrinomonadaceae bacterium]
MFCPQCGQRQLSNEVRFCSSCGFPLNVVSEALAGGGKLQFRPAPPPVSAPLSPRQKGVRQGAMLMLSTLLVVPLVAILGVELLDLPAEIAGLAAVLCFVGGLLRILYAVFLEDKYPPAVAPFAEQPYVPPPTLPNYLGTPQPRAGSLPAAKTPPVAANTYQPPRYDTGELAPPSASVTDHTTRLLNREPNESREE